MAHLPVSFKFGQTSLTTSGRGLDNDETVVSHGHTVDYVSVALVTHTVRRQTMGLVRNCAVRCEARCEGSIH